MNRFLGLLRWTLLWGILVVLAALPHSGAGDEATLAEAPANAVTADTFVAVPAATTPTPALSTFPYSRASDEAAFAEAPANAVTADTFVAVPAATTPTPALSTFPYSRASDEATLAEAPAKAVAADTFVAVPAAPTPTPAVRPTSVPSPRPPCKDPKGGTGECSPRDVSGFVLLDEESGVVSYLPEAPTMEEIMEMGLRLVGASPVQMAFRGTASSETIRCDWRGIARTAEQREEAIRFWVGLDEDDEIPDAPSRIVVYVSHRDA